MLYNSEIQNAFYRLKVKKVKFFSIGKSVLGKDILCTHIGSKQGKQIVIQGAIHSREWITTLLICRQIESLIGKNLNGGIYFIPLANPDGVDISINGTKNLPCSFLKNWMRENVDEFALLKANANLVDLNVNFDAHWGKGKQNSREAGAENFIGFKPESEAEVKALVKFVKKVKPDATISYHSKGDVIYYNFGNNKTENEKGKNLAGAIKKYNGYNVVKLKGSTGGFKDYCINSLHIPSLTIEVGDDSLTHPLGKKDLPKILKQNLKVPLLLLENI